MTAYPRGDDDEHKHVPLPIQQVTGCLHGGPHDGETILLPWARIEIPFPRFEEFGSAQMSEALYRLRGPWRGQEHAAYDYVEPDLPARKRRPRLRRLIRWLWLRWA